MRALVFSRHAPGMGCLTTRMGGAEVWEGRGVYRSVGEVVGELWMTGMMELGQWIVTG